MMTPPDSLSIRTGARLHFGLLDTQVPYGGLGVMVDQPQTKIVFRESDCFTADASIDDRARPIAMQVARLLGCNELPAVEIRCVHSAPRHNGFGSGTQISMAIAEGLCRWCGIEMDPIHLAREIACRGKRSAVGVHGYFAGGLIYEDATKDNRFGDRLLLNRIEHRAELPKSWKLLLIRRRIDSPTVHGETEKQKFARLPHQPDRRKELRDMIVGRLLPAAESADFDVFAETIQSYNRSSGMLFEAVQGGPYNGPVVSNLIETLLSLGASGVGQSSWGPGVFCWCPDENAAVNIKEQFSAREIECWITSVRNEGRTAIVQDRS